MLATPCPCSVILRTEQQVRYWKRRCMPRVYIELELQARRSCISPLPTICPARCSHCRDSGNFSGRFGKRAETPLSGLAGCSRILNSQAPRDDAPSQAKGRLGSRKAISRSDVEHRLSWSWSSHESPITLPTACRTL